MVSTLLAVALQGSSRDGRITGEVELPGVDWDPRPHGITVRGESGSAATCEVTRSPEADVSSWPMSLEPSLTGNRGSLDAGDALDEGNLLGGLKGGVMQSTHQNGPLYGVTVI